jgi:hypothetical protein
MELKYLNASNYNDIHTCKNSESQYSYLDHQVPTNNNNYSVSCKSEGENDLIVAFLDELNNVQLERKNDYEKLNDWEIVGFRIGKLPYERLQSSKSFEIIIYESCYDGNIKKLVYGDDIHTEYLLANELFKLEELQITRLEL